jgi:hypothetical protein
MLDITMWKDGGFIEIAGTIDPGIVLTRSSASYSPLEVGKNRGINTDVIGTWVGKDK